MEVVFGFFSVVLAVMTLVFAFTLSKRTDRLIQSEDKRVKELLAKMEEGTGRQNEILLEIQRSAAEIQRSAERIEETQKYIAELVRIEGEKTRSLLSH